MADLTEEELDAENAKMQEMVLDGYKRAEKAEVRVRKLENMLGFVLEDYGCDMRDEEVESIRRLLEKPKKGLLAKEGEGKVCKHDWVPTFQDGDTYQCSKCGKEMDMTED